MQQSNQNSPLTRGDPKGSAENGIRLTMLHEANGQDTLVNTFSGSARIVI